MAAELYDHAYGNFGHAAEAAVRRETYGEDIGQSSWTTAGEWLHFADQLGVQTGHDVLEVGSGSGGPAVYLAAERHCNVTGVDINEHGVRNARALAGSKGLEERLRFEVVDAARPLPFPAASFDAVISNDAMCHIPDRLSVLRDWHRLLRPGGRMLFTDALVITGPVTSEEIANRASIGFYMFVPAGENERLIREAGFTHMSTEDVTEAAALVSSRRRAARERHRSALVDHEGEANFAGVQRFLETVHVVASERRLSRYAYLAHG
jgi:SAM-dependent methyltransferase